MVKEGERRQTLDVRKEGRESERHVFIPKERKKERKTLLLSLSLAPRGGNGGGGLNDDTARLYADDSFPHSLFIFFSLFFPFFSLVFFPLHTYLLPFAELFETTSFFNSLLRLIKTL